MGESPGIPRCAHSNANGCGSMRVSTRARGSHLRAPALLLKDRRLCKCWTRPRQRAVSSLWLSTYPAIPNYRSVDGKVDHELRFTDRYTYDSRRKGIAVPALLRTGGRKVELLVGIDTGASDCLFEHAYGRALGLR